MVVEDPGRAGGHPVVNSASGHAGTVFQANNVNGPVSLGVPRCEPQPGLVSVEPPVGRLAGELHGRDALLAGLTAAVDRADGALIVLSGAGGLGKTAIALALARRLRRRAPDFPVWWVDAATGPGLVAGLREVALAAGADLPDVVSAWSGGRSAPDLLHQALRKAPGPWLLIVDNADDVRLLANGGSPSDGTGWVRPVTGTRGVVLVTTRERSAHAWGTAAEHHDVRPLAPDASIRLLNADSAAAAEAGELAARLGHMPLALHLAGRYVTAVRDGLDVPGLVRPRDYAEYGDMFRERFPEIDALHRLGGEPDERRLLNRTWELSLDLLTDRGLRWARQLLRLLACFGPGAVSSLLLDARVLTGTALFEGITAEDVEATLRGLLDLGLLERAEPRAPECLWLHPVIREANRHQQDVVDHVATYLALCLAVLDGATTELGFAAPDRARWAVLAPQCEYVVAQVEQRSAELRPRYAWELMASKLTCRLGRLARATGSYARAADQFDAAVRVRTRHLDRWHPEVVAIRRERLSLEWEHRPARAVLDGLAALAESCRAWLGEQDPLTIACLHDVAQARAEAGEGRVGEHYREVVRLRRRLLGHDDVESVSAQLALVTALWENGSDACEAEFGVLRAMVDGLGDGSAVDRESLREHVAGLLARYRETRG
ncbi:AAA family ATPase [Saccharothrix obliqua]|uniref:AAA family ATPase n=1 Tax=Saccharothrix obliqua TaxID=2861747 RepID=UPI001C5D0185|nr:AAA family ATPase [Saccharothrix obliqua]MBW4718322.1 hypothetical protein [Saccharothrix obliqua]